MSDKIASYKPRPPKEERHDGPFDDYEVKDALRTLSDACKIRKNRKLMAACKKEAKRQMAATAETAKSLDY